MSNKVTELLKSYKGEIIDIHTETDDLEKFGDVSDVEFETWDLYDKSRVCKQYIDGNGDVHSVLKLYDDCPCVQLRVVCGVTMKQFKERPCNELECFARCSFKDDAFWNNV